MDLGNLVLKVHSNEVSFFRVETLTSFSPQPRGGKGLYFRARVTPENCKNVPIEGAAIVH